MEQTEGQTLGYTWTEEQQLLITSDARGGVIINQLGDMLSIAKDVQLTQLGERGTRRYIVRVV